MNYSKNETILDFAKKYDKEIKTKFDKNEKIKLCSSDDFTNAAKFFEEKYSSKDAPLILSQVGGFYVIASLTGIANQVCKNKPSILFFDRKDNNIKNALYNTLLIKSCSCKEEYITALFGLSNTNIIKALKPKDYFNYIKEVLSLDNDFSDLTAEEKKEQIKILYHDDKENIDKQIEEIFITDELVKIALKNDFNINKIVKYAKKQKYDKNAHYELLINKTKGSLDSKMFKTFKMLANNMTEYLAQKENYKDLLKYLSADLKLNGDYHILNNDEYYNSYQKMITRKGTGNIKFLPNIDISNSKGVKQLENILDEEKIVDETNQNNFPVALAFIPHINILTNSYNFIKQNVEDYIMLSKDNYKNQFIMNSTATLDQRDFRSIGAEFIKDERKKHKPLKDLSPLESQKGFPLLTFIAGSNYGNIYHSEIDTENMIDMAINDKVDTVYIQGLIYGTYYHYQTSRRLLNDPDYETLDSRLKAAHKIIKRLNDAGIKVVYQMGDEEKNLYQDMFKIYVREQGVVGNNFLKREDLRTKYDWVRPIIINDLIPYLIRSGEDVTNFYTDEAKETRVSKLCHALKLYKEDLPLGDLKKYINPEYLHDTDMFKVVYNTIEKYDENDDAISVNLMSNPNYSSNTQYGKPNDAVIKNLKLFQTGAVKKYKLESIPQLFVDGRQGLMSIGYKGGNVTLNVPQMINDGYYIENPDLLTGVKETVLEDPTRKRVAQIHTKPNFPGGWTITGDAREKMSIVPYYRRVREVLEHVQKTGEALPELNVLHLNDTQLGSLTERIEYTLKILDYAFYHYNIKGIWGNGDFQQGWNYPSFANESRHLASSSTTSQMIDFVKLQRPWMQNAMGVIKDDLFKDDEILIQNQTAEQIIKHLKDKD